MSISIHYLSLMVMLRSIGQSLEKNQRHFLWRKGEDGRGMHLVSWERVYTPKDKGGASLHCLQSMNKALVCKWLWRFGLKVGSLWRQVVFAKFGLVDGWDTSVHRGPYGHSLWRGIMQFSSLFKKGLAYAVGDGWQINFWEDIWCGERSLKVDILAVFGKGADPTSIVETNFSMHGGEVVCTSVLRRALYNWEISRVTQLLARL